MRRLLHALLLVALTVGLVGVASPAQAAAKPGVTISKSVVAKPAFAATTAVKPKYKKGPRTKIVSAKVTVKGKTKAGKVVNATGKSVRVTAGTYKVTTKVVFKVKKTKKTKKWSAKKSRSKTWTHVIAEGAKNCATMADYNAIEVGTALTFGSFKGEVEKLVAHVGRSDGALSLEDMFWYFYGQGDMATAGYVVELQELYGDYAELELITYDMCASTSKIEVLYVNWIYDGMYYLEEVIDKEIV